MESEDWFTVDRTDRALQIRFQGSHATAVYYFVTPPSSLLRRILARMGVTGRGDVVFIGGEWIIEETKEDETSPDEPDSSTLPVDTDDSPSYLGPNSSAGSQTPQQSGSVEGRYESLADDSTPRVITRPPESVLSELDRRGYTYQGIASASVDHPAVCLDICSINDVFESVPEYLVDTTDWDPDFPQENVQWNPPTLSASTAD